MGEKITTIQDIADRLKITRSTVSRALSDSPRISDKTKKKVREIAKELNYVPNTLASNLRKGKSFTIAYVVPDISNPFFAKIGRLIESIALKEGYFLLVGSTDEDAKKEEALINNLMNRQIDGLVLASTKVNSKVVKNLVDRNFPLILFDRVDEKVDGNYVLVENEQSMQKATESLILQGCKKLGLLSITPELYPLNARIAGFKKALESNHFEINTDLIRKVDNNNIKESTHAEMAYLIEQEVDGVVFTNNTMASQAIWNVNMYYKDLAEKLKFASFDNLELFDYSLPKITSIAQPIEFIARNIAHMLLDLMDKKEMQVKKLVLEPNLIKR
ncbi:MAG: LacI family DNA-binding transcriptional regulator [Salinivirgaceae bacterium]|nr:LacI family DNA-binding transcriptional regulator [Salinivirgaceae bacterium]